MPTETHVFLDTNILLRGVTQGRPGCEIEHWRSLRAIVESSEATLLMPEIVLLEFEKQLKEFEFKINSEFKNLHESISKVVDNNQKQKGDKKIWNEIENVGPSLLDHLETIKQDKLRSYRENQSVIQSFLGSGKLITLPFDLDVMLRGQKRLIAGRFKVSESKNDRDCYIVESLICHFEKNAGDHRLLFCSGNTKDFALDTTRSLHPTITGDLPPSKLFLDLRSLVDFIHEHRVIVEPTPEEVNEALKREREMRIEEELNSREAISAFLKYLKNYKLISNFISDTRTNIAGFGTGIIPPQIIGAERKKTDL